MTNLRLLFLTPMITAALAQEPSQPTFAQIQTQAVQGDANAQARMGEAYLNGNYGLAPDCTQALAWTQKAAAQGSARAKLNLAIHYLNACGTAYDYTQAQTLLDQAHQAGEKKAARYLGIIYERGLGVPQDYAQAARYYRQADQNGDITGQYRLAKLYEQGLGVPRDFAAARALYLKHTGRQDHITAPSFQALGDFYAFGLGVDKNPAEAQKWYRLAKQAEKIK